MELKQIREGDELTIQIVGSLNALTSPELEKMVNENLADVNKLVLDMTQMEYTSSAGLRIIMGAQQDVESKGGSMVVRGASEFVMDIFEETGFISFLDFE